MVWQRDAGQCAYVSPTGRRCTERTFLEFHHIQAYALQGPATVANISLRCWRHNQYEAELVFGPHSPSGEYAPFADRAGSPGPGTTRTHRPGDAPVLRHGPVPTEQNSRLE